MSQTRPTFVVNTPLRDLSAYRALAQAVKRLKRHGHVEMNIASLAEKSRHELPPQGSPWHEYASWSPAPEKFFPDEMVAPFIPESFVRANRELLLAKAQMLREMDLGAAFWSYTPNFLPEPFFDRYPHMRGPRTDHPRRSRAEAFAPCVDAPETREMITRMVRNLGKEVPELGTFFFKTNDAGPGLCWSDWQYIGSNGPSHCRHRGVGDRVGGLLEAIQRGGQEAGLRLSVHMTGNFSRTELQTIEDHLPNDCAMRELPGASVTVRNMADHCYPARGIFDPLDVLDSLQSLRTARPRTVFLDLRCNYDRGAEDLEISEKIAETVDDFLAQPAFGPLAMLQRLRDLCDRWAGEDAGELLFETLVEMHEALEYKRAALPRLSTNYGGVSLRYITRPLVACPHRLTPEEEAHFLPHVFNVSHERAREDYIDVHGTRHLPTWLSFDSTDPRIWPVEHVRQRLLNVARRLSDLSDAPNGAPWKRMSGALTVYASVLRSCSNFYAMQIVRDRNAKILASPQPLAAARGDWAGHPDLALINDLMRDELDNTAELCQLIDRQGLNLITHAACGSDEDTFLLGPDLCQQLRAKMRTMRRHAMDVEQCLPTPNR